MREANVRGHLDLLLLQILSAGPAHGYAVITALRERSEGVFDLPEGTVYPALHRLEEAGLLASDWARVDGRRRRMYLLTPAGRAAMRQERREWKALVGAVDAVLHGPAVAGARP